MERSLDLVQGFAQHTTNISHLRPRCALISAKRDIDRPKLGRPETSQAGEHANMGEALLTGFPATSWSLENGKKKKEKACSDVIITCIKQRSSTSSGAQTVEQVNLEKMKRSRSSQQKKPFALLREESAPVPVSDRRTPPPPPPRSYVPGGVIRPCFSSHLHHLLLWLPAAAFKQQP